MSIWSWLRKPRPSAKTSKLGAGWLAPDENPWGLEVLDCTEPARTVTSATRSAEIAKKFAQLRHFDGQELMKANLTAVVSLPCSLSYAIDKRPPDGPVFKSRIMEEKWDIYLYGEYLYFCRSWRGDLMYRAAAKCDVPALTISRLDVLFSGTDKNIAVQEVDFLVKSHLLFAKALHPLPRGLSKDPQQLALVSFTSYGRMGLYGTFEDTIGTAIYPFSQAGS